MSTFLQNSAHCSVLLFAVILLWDFGNMKYLNFAITKVNIILKRAVLKTVFVGNRYPGKISKELLALQRTGSRITNFFSNVCS